MSLFGQMAVAKDSARPRLTSGVFTSRSDDWETPTWLFRRLDEQFHFLTDVCADSLNAKCQHHFSIECDGLLQKWAGMCWMNPPYGSQIGKWVGKAFRAATEGHATVVCLLPARTDTRWWHDYCKHGEITFLKGRLRFGNKGPAPFPSAIVTFHAHLDPGGITRYEEWKP